MIAQGVNWPVKELGRTQQQTMVEEYLARVLRTLFHNPQRIIQLVACNVVEQVMLDLLRKDVCGKMSDAHITKFLDTCAAAVWLSRRLLTSILFIAPIETFVRGKKNTGVKEKTYSFASASKEPMDTVSTFINSIKSSQIRADCSDDEMPLTKGSKRHYKRFHRRQRSRE